METLIALTLLAILSASGLYGWQRWQQHQHLWQSGIAVRDYLLWLRSDASAHNRAYQILQADDEQGACLTVVSTCEQNDPRVLRLAWPEVSVDEVTPALGFYGLRDTAWGGHIRLKSPAGRVVAVVSGWGRIRLCQTAEATSCQ